MIDTHCHVQNIEPPAWEHMYRAAQAIGVSGIIAPSAMQHDWQRLRQYASTHAHIYPAFGLHPWHCEHHRLNHLCELETLLPQSIAIGECGLDMGKHRAPMPTQMQWLMPQVELAMQHDLPLILHACKAEDVLLKTLKQHKVKRAVLHGFSGSLQQATAWAKHGFQLGIGSRILQANAQKLREIVQHLPIESLLPETDAPYGLQADGSKGNAPAQLIEIISAIAMIRRMDSAALQDIFAQQTKELFTL